MAILRSQRRRRIIGLTLILLGIAIASYPFLPSLRYAVWKPPLTIPYQTRLASNSAAFASLPGLPKIGNRPIPQENRIIIPRIGVNMPILEGPNEKVLDRGGVWRIPGTSTPDAGGNVVVSGHRWKYLPPSAMSLYLLDKVKDKDPIIVYWRGKEYDYVVTGREIVRPNQTEILQNTDGPRLTIFTCTPIYSTKYRLVLYGHPLT